MKTVKAMSSEILCAFWMDLGVSEQVLMNLRRFYTRETPKTCDHVSGVMFWSEIVDMSEDQRS